MLPTKVVKKRRCQMLSSAEMVEAREHGRGFFINGCSYPWRSPEAMGEKNGAASLAEMREGVERHRRGEPAVHGDYLDCLLQSEPFFRPLVLGATENIAMVVSAVGETITLTPKHRMASVSLLLPNSRGQG